MGSLLKSTSKTSPVSSKYYSMRKQSTWHVVSVANTVITPNNIGKAEKVDPSRYCHQDSNLILIP